MGWRRLFENRSHGANAIAVTPWFHAARSSWRIPRLEGAKRSASLSKKAELIKFAGLRATLWRRLPGHFRGGFSAKDYHLVFGPDGKNNRMFLSARLRVGRCYS